MRLRLASFGLLALWTVSLICAESGIAQSEMISSSEAIAIAQAHLDKTEDSKFVCGSDKEDVRTDADGTSYMIMCKPTSRSERHLRLVRIHRLTKEVAVSWIM